MRRKRFSKMVVGIVVGLISFVFVFYGVFAPQGTSQGWAGKVNSDVISLSEFGRELNRLKQLYRNAGFDEARVTALGLERQVFDQLVTRKLLQQEASRQGWKVSDESVRKSISETPGFQVGDQFDMAQYKRVLSQYGFTPGSYERQLRADQLGRWIRRHLNDVSHVSKLEAEREYRLANEKRKIKYVLITTEAGRKALSISRKEIQTYLADEKNKKRVESRFQSLSKTKYKNKKLTQVESEIAREMIAMKRNDEARNKAKEIAKTAASAFGASKAADSKVNAVLKKYEVKVQTSPDITQKSTYLPGIGNSEEIMADLFAPKSPIDPKAGGRAKVYDNARGTIVALMASKTSADFSKFDEKERAKLQERLERSKSSQLYNSFIAQLRESSKIEVNPEVVPEKAQRPGFNFKQN